MRPRFSFSSHRTRNIENIRKQRPKYPDLARKVVEQSDIILEILDSRFIDETRNKPIEEIIKKKNKRIIFVLNKSDLIDIQKLKKELSSYDSIYPFIFFSCKTRKGNRELRNKIKIEAKKIIKEGKIIVGVIGYPNTGKSSLINILVGKRSAGVGSDAGFTKGIQKIKLSENVLLADTPGVIPVEKYSHAKTELITEHTKLGGKSYSQIKNPEDVIVKIMKEYPGLFEKFYKIDAKGDVDLLLEELGKKRGFMKRGGEPNTDMAARLILKDWQLGNIRL